jgi:hypothetical protein
MGVSVSFCLAPLASVALWPDAAMGFNINVAIHAQSAARCRHIPILELNLMRFLLVD